MKNCVADLFLEQKIFAFHFPPASRILSISSVKETQFVDVSKVYEVVSMEVFQLIEHNTYLAMENYRLCSVYCV